MGWRDFLPFGARKSLQTPAVPAPVEMAEKPSRDMSARNRRLTQLSIVAANKAGGSSAWTGTGDADDYNREYLEALPVVQQRAQDLDVNNPDVHGYHRTRAAQVVGRGIRFSAAIRGADIGLPTEGARQLNLTINRRRALHSKSGGMDAAGRGRSEGKLQEVAFLTHQILGSVLIHRVLNFGNDRLSPLAIEIIPTTRLTTPYSKMGDPTVSFGIQYSDEYRTRVTGFWVRKPARTRGNAFVNIPEWDFIPAEDAVLLSLTEQAGLDRALPACTSLVRTLRNKGDFTESALTSARAHARRPVAIECAEGDDPYARAQDDQSEASATGDVEGAAPIGFITVGDAEIMYTSKGEKVVNLAAALPSPDYPGFIRVADARCARGFVTSISRFTREVQASYSAGRQEEQQDEPVVDQLREAFENAWQIVHGWFIDSLYFTDLELPNFSAATRIYYHEAVVAPLTGKLAINPVDTANARKLNLAMRTVTPQQVCAEDGRDYEGNLDEWARAIKLVREKEHEYSLPEGSLDILLDAKAVVSVMDDQRDAIDQSGGRKPAPEKNGESLSVVNRVKSYVNGKNGAAHASH